MPRNVPTRITLIGSGNVATHFGKAFRKAGAEIVQVYSRDPAHARVLAKTLRAKAEHDLSRIAPGADLYLVAVKDDALPEIVRGLKVGDGIVAHTAGSVPMNVLKKFKRHGVLYPLQTFSKKRAARTQNVPLCLEASDKRTLTKLQQLAQPLQGKIYRLDSEQRRIAHLAAVFACNFTNHLYAIADELLQEQQLPFGLIRPLILETAMKAQELSPADAQTGPALRNDRTVIDSHLRLLRRHPAWQQLYEALSADITRKRKK